MADPAGGLYMVDRRQHRVVHVSPAGLVTAVAGDPQGRPGDADGFRGRARFRFPHGLARDAAGSLYVADGDNDRIRKIAQTGFVTTVAGSVRGYGDGAALSAKFENPVAIAVDRRGELYVADYGNHAIRKVTP